MITIDLINTLTGNPFPSTVASGRKVFLILNGQRYMTRVTLGYERSHYELVLAVDGYDTLKVATSASLASGQAPCGVLVNTPVYERGHYGPGEPKYGSEFEGHAIPGGGPNMVGLVWVAVFDGNIWDEAAPHLPVVGEDETRPWIRNPTPKGLAAVEFGPREALAARGIVIPEINQHWPPKGLQCTVPDTRPRLRNC